MLTKFGKGENTHFEIISAFFTIFLPQWVQIQILRF